MIHFIMLSFLLFCYAGIGITLGVIIKDMFGVDSTLMKILAVFLWPLVLVIGIVFGIFHIIKYIFKK